MTDENKNTDLVSSYEKQEKDKLEQFIIIYESSPNTRAIAKFVISSFGPIGSAVEDGILVKYRNIQVERLSTLLRELEKGERYLTPELITSEPFIHDVISVMRSAAQTKDHEKIKLFARLLTNAARYRKNGTDEFEEFLRILNDLSLREYALLDLLRKHEDRLNERLETGQNSTEIRNSQYSVFRNEAHSLLGIELDELKAMMAGLTRTGLYSELTGGLSLASENQLGAGKLSPRYRRFAKWLLENK